MFLGQRDDPGGCALDRSTIPGAVAPVPPARGAWPSPESRPRPRSAAPQGRSPGWRTKAPRGALTSSTSPVRSCRVQERAGGSLRFLLNAYAITAGVRQIGKRVAPQDRRRVRHRTESQHHELSGQRDRQGKAVRRLQHQRNHAATLANYSGHFQRPEAWRGRGQLFRGSQARISRLRPRLSPSAGEELQKNLSSRG